MKCLDEMTTREEVNIAFDRATRHLSRAQIDALKSHPQPDPADSAIIAHAKEVWRKSASFSGVVYGEKPGDLMHHPV